jgi:hypothetical protein
MTQPVYVAHAALEQLARLRRRATLAAGGVAEFGVHGPLREHYRLETDREAPFPVDYIVAATGG